MVLVRPSLRCPGRRILQLFTIKIMNEMNWMSWQLNANMCAIILWRIKYRGWPYWRPHCTKSRRCVMHYSIIPWRWAKVSWCPCKMRISKLYIWVFAKYGNTLFYIRLIPIGLMYPMCATVLCYGMQYPSISTHFTRSAKRTIFSRALAAKFNLTVKVLDVNCEGRLF